MNSTLCEEYCPIYTQNIWMFETILYFGSTISIISVLENCLIFYSLLCDQRCFRSHFLFLLFLSLFDIITSALYIPVIVVDQARSRYEMPRLESIWASYSSTLLTFCNVSLTSSCYLIVVIQLERFLITLRKGGQYINRERRKYFAIFAVGFAILLKGPILFELEVCLKKWSVNFNDLKSHLGLVIYEK